MIRAESQTMMLPCLTASIQFCLCRRVLGETRMKSKHSAGMRAWGITLIKQQLLLSFFQHSILPVLLLPAEFWDHLVVHWAHWHKPHPRVHHEQQDDYNLCPAAWKPSVPSSSKSSGLPWLRLEQAQQL